MKPLTIHVGPHKTGTTSIQNHLHSHRRELAEQGVAYPSFFPPLPCHNQLVFAFAEGDGGKYLSTVLETLERSPRGILSGEEFSVPRRKGLRTGLRHLESKFSVSYVFVRRDLIDRTAAHVIRAGANGKLDTETVDGARQYLSEIHQFQQEQLDFFAQRRTKIIEYNDLNAKGVEWFVETAFDIKLPQAKQRLNTSEGLSVDLLAMPIESRRNLAYWLNSNLVTEILLSGDTGQAKALSTAIKARVREIVEPA